jgi:hypothetical protein
MSLSHFPWSNKHLSFPFLTVWKLTHLNSRGQTFERNLVKSVKSLNGLYNAMPVIMTVLSSVQQMGFVPKEAIKIG